MTYILRADEGKWLYYQETEVLPDPTTDKEMITFTKEVRTSVPLLFKECNDDWKLWYESEWVNSHPDPEPESE